MAQDTSQMTRAQIYHLVWSEPLTKAAPSIGLSDVGLANLCKRNNIPRPPAGHWIRRQYGRRDLPPELPGDPASLIEFSSSTPSTRRPKPPSPKIVVARSLSQPHPLVEKTQRLVTEARHEEHGLLVLGRDPHLAIKVGRKTAARALRILDSLIKSLEKRGHRVLLEGSFGRRPRTVVQVGSQTVSFQIRERVHRRVHELTREERQHHRRFGWSGAPTFDYRLSGLLMLEIDPSFCRGHRRRWIDRQYRPLEGVLGEALVELEGIAEDMRLHHLRREAAERDRETRQRQLEQEEERRRCETKAVEELKRLADNWRLSHDIRGFLKDLQNAKGPSEDKGAWIRWALHVADTLDPCLNRSAVQEAAKWLMKAQTIPGE